VGTFIQLSDLNIGDNPHIRSLKGIEQCLNLKYLNCNGCDLESIEEVRNLKKLETLNLANNRKLDSI
jgi:Leucine-rich repeat (LRR) protein